MFRRLSRTDTVVYERSGINCIFCRVKLKALGNDHPHLLLKNYDQIIFILLFQILHALCRTKSERRYFCILIIHGLNRFPVRANKLSRVLAALSSLNEQM